MIAKVIPYELLAAFLFVTFCNAFTVGSVPTLVSWDTQSWIITMQMLPTDVPVVFLYDQNIWFSAVTIFLHVLIWTIIAQWEDKRHVLTNIFRSPKTACDSLVVLILFSSIYRDLKFFAALGSQPRWIVLQNNSVLLIGYSCMLVGCIFIFSSFYTQGFCKTFLGEYYNFIIDGDISRYSHKRFQNPVCWGSTLIFLSLALLKASFSGIILTTFMVVCYKISLSIQRRYILKEYNTKLKTR